MPDASIEPQPSPVSPVLVGQTRRRRADRSDGAERSRLSLFWYRMAQWFFSTYFAATFGIRATGRQNVPAAGACMLVSNHLSHLDVLVLGMLLDRPLNFVARSTLFFFPLGLFIRSMGAFPIQRDGIGAQGLKETLRRLKNGGIVTLFPEGTRTLDGELGEMKSGIAMLAAKAKVPVIPTAIAGTFEAWPRSRSFPVGRPLWVHFGEVITPEQVKSLGPDELTALIRQRILECQIRARSGLARQSGVNEW